MSSKKYFSDLNYSLGNEDTGFEVDLLKELKPDRVLSIAGCGSRLWPLMAHGAKEVVGLDVAPQQLAISELRLEGIRSFTHEEYLMFWGFPPYGAYDYSFERKALFNKLNLSAETRNYFAKLFESSGYQSLLYAGKWERTFATLSRVVRSILRGSTNDLFEFHDLESQIHYYHNKFPMRKWKAILFMLGNKTVFDALLYKGDFIKKNVPESHFDYYFENFQRLFLNRLARESFFAHLCFHGKITHEDGNTVEAKRDVFMAMQKALKAGCQTKLESMDLLSVARAYEGHGFDFLSLSDVPSYFSGEIERDFMQKMLPILSSKGVVVVRSYLREPECNLDGFDEITPRFGELIAREGVQMYRIKIYQKAP